MTRVRVKHPADGRDYVESTSVTAQNISPTKLYILAAGDSHYYQITVDSTGTGSIVCTDVGATAPTDGILITA